jgi:hypothetical protein
LVWLDAVRSRVMDYLEFYGGVIGGGSMV